jgi:phosphate transport system substrate-binding protein
MGSVNRQALMAMLLSCAVFANTATACRGNTEGAGPCGGADKLSGEGSTTAAEAMTVFASAWSEACPGKQLSYRPSGSSDGRAQFIAGKFDFAASDSALSDKDRSAAEKRCGGSPVLNLPLVFTSLALVYNLPGVNEIALNGPTLARMFSGNLPMWSSPEAAALNGPLPDVPVTPVFRSDPSGINNDFQKFLSETAGRAWDVNATGSDFLGGAGVGAVGSDGVIQAVKSTPGAIGYVELDAAVASGLPVAQIDSGKWRAGPTAAAAALAVDSTEFAAEGDDLALNSATLFGTSEPGGYPLVQISYIVVCSAGDPAKAAALKSFLKFAVGPAQNKLEGVGSVPMPGELKMRFLEVVDKL